MLFSKMIRAFALGGLVMSATITPIDNLSIAQNICYGTAIGSGLGFLARSNHQTSLLDVAVNLTCIAAGVYGAWSWQANHRRCLTTPVDRRLEKDAQHRRDHAWAYQNLPTAEEYAAARPQAARN
jgi:hypothetical protein